MTAKFGTPYFSNYINSDMDPTSIRAMCVHPDTLITIKVIDTGDVFTLPIKEVFEKYKLEEYLIFTKEGFRGVKSEYIFDFKADVFEVTTESGKVLITTPDHPWRVWNEDAKYLSAIRADNLTIGHKIITNDSTNKDNIVIESIVSIKTIPYNGKVYDVEINTSGDYNNAHTFYANGILTGNCCRLRLDLRELRKKSGGYFGSGESTGSVGVVTINMPRIGYLAKDEEDFYKRLDNLLDISARSLKIKRNIITKLLDDGLYPYTKRYLGTFNNHFSTIGLVGMNEACLNAKWLRKDLTTPEAQKFTKEVLNHMRERLSDYQEKYGDLYNLEATPAESTSYRLAKHDKEKYPDIITASVGKDPYYTNSSHLPVGYTNDVFEALDAQDELQTLYTSGTVFHAFLGEKLPSWQSAMRLVRKIAENYRLPYYTLSPTYSICKDHGYITGEVYSCPNCGSPTEVYSRITGYYRPVQNWNNGKSQEFKQRKVYQVTDSIIANKKTNRLTDDNVTLDNKHLTIENKSNVATDEEVKILTLKNSDKVLLFSTMTCPNCKMVEMMLNKANIGFSKIVNGESKESDDLFRYFNITKVPTLVVNPKEADQMTYDNISDIKKYLSNK